VSNELPKFKTKVTKENFVTVQKEVEAINRDHQSKFAEIDNRLERLQERVTASSSRHTESASADRVSNEVIELGRQTLPDPSSVVASSSDRDESVREKHVYETRVSPSSSVTQVEPQVIVPSDKSHVEQNDIAGLRQFQFNGNAISDLALPKFTDARRQNVMDFLAELLDYFKLKNIPESLKLPLAVKSVTDPYSRIWISAVCGDMQNF
jgi:hypothetical protein